MRRSGISIVALIMVMSAGLFSVSAAHAQQSGGVTVVVQTYDRATQASITDACYVIVNASNEGCDENGDGAITFQGVPVGSYTVQQTQGSSGYLPVGAFPIFLNIHDREQFFPVYMNSSSGVVAPVADISVASVDAATGQSLPGACYILHGGSIEGCDENGNGFVDFADVPVGSYLLEQTLAPVGHDIVLSRWVGITGDGTILVEHGPPPVGGEAPLDYDVVDVALVTRDPASGQLLTGACYIIENASIEGCDENGDGQVDFADVAAGVFTVTQTVAPRGFATVNAFEINITGYEPAESFVVAQRPEQQQGGNRHVSIVLYDPDTGQRILNSRACLVLEGVSAEGCDDNGDGQIDFLDIPVGDHMIEVTRLPLGYTTVFAEYSIPVESNAPYSIVKGIVTFVEVPRGR